MGVKSGARANRRRWSGALAAVLAVIALAVTAGVSGSASAAGGSKPAQTGAGKPQEEAPRLDKPVAKSMITGTPFPKPPFPLADDGTYAAYTGAIAAENGSRCRSLEAVGWDLKEGDQAGLQSIVDATMDAIQNGGFKATQFKPKSTEGSPAVSIAIDNGKKKGFVVWGPIGKGVVLLICETVPVKK